MRHCDSTVENRPAPKYRDAEFVRTAVKYAARLGEPFLGHKSIPLPARWPGFDFYRYTPGEMMHGKLFSTHTHTDLTLPKPFCREHRFGTCHEYACELFHR